MSRAPVKLVELPLGSRFRYLNGTDVWVLLDRFNCALIAAAPDINYPLWRQSICSAGESEAETRALMVEFVDVREI